MKEFYDVIVIGAGHAGVEAALAAARMKRATLLVCLDFDAVSLMACNPAIGGTAKGQLVREIDALGGQMGLSADATLLQIKILNSAKGPAVFSLRGQQDKHEYHEYMLSVVRSQENLDMLEDECTALLVKDGRATGVDTANTGRISAKSVVLCTGVYLNGKVIIGDYSKPSGPSGYAAATHLTQNLIDLGVSMRRFKTGTPARIYRDSIDFDEMQPEYGDGTDRFSFMSDCSTFDEEPCYLTYTNAETHKIIRDNISRSPLYNGAIKSTGPRYCPSIETKVMRFADKDKHQIFIEPEGKDSVEMYVQGMSSSLPHDVQEAMYHTLNGLRHCVFAKYAYAIEYDCIDPLSLYPSLEMKRIKGVYCAGQLNGSSGYEEAAAQGLIAGINAALSTEGKNPLVLARDEAYIGVLIDDLVTKGTNEPYRMMTARAEHRIKLRQDNSDFRLTEKGYAIGLADKDRLERMHARRDEVARIKAYAESTTVKQTAIKELYDKKGLDNPDRGLRLADLVRRPEIELEDVEPFFEFEHTASAFFTAIEDVKYEGYLKKQESAVAEQRRLEEKKLPIDLDYSKIKGLRLEARDKLNEIRPFNLGQASRISGVSPADVTVLIVYLKEMESKAKREE